jgi:hypothetical protein
MVGLAWLPALDGRLPPWETKLLAGRASHIPDCSARYVRQLFRPLIVPITYPTLILSFLANPLRVPRQSTLRLVP